MAEVRLKSPRTAYIVGLALIALMVICQLAGTRLLSAKQEISALEINLPGRQSMLSQRISLEVKRLSRMDIEMPPEDVARTWAIILNCTELMEASHAALVVLSVDEMRQALASGDECIRPTFDMPVLVPSPALDIEGAPILAQFTKMARSVALGEIPRDEIGLNFVSYPTLTTLLLKLDTLTYEAQELSIGQIKAFVAFGWVLLFALILGEMAFIFQPMARSVDASIKRLRLANQKLWESEKRLQDFASTGAHRFWETDKNHVFKWVAAAGSDRRVPDKKLFLGRQRWEVGALSSDVNSVDWTAHKATLAAKRPFKKI